MQIKNKKYTIYITLKQKNHLISQVHMGFKAEQWDSFIVLVEAIQM